MSKRQAHPIACSLPKFVKITNENGETEIVLGFPTFLFEVIEMIKTDQVRID